MKILSFFVLLLTPYLAFSQDWVTDFEEAKSRASSKNINIILVFQGSDWCAPCIKLDRELWSTSEFIEYAEDHFVLLQADFPRKKTNKLPPEQQEKNNGLAERYNSSGFFPFVVILDPTGKVLGETGYKKMSVAQHIEFLSTF